MIFILGGRGFVGSAFARRCAAIGRPFAVIDRENYEEYAGRSCNILINAAGNSRKFLSRQAPLQDFDASVRSVRASLIDFRFDKYLLISSADVYPDSSSPATTSESQVLDVSKMSAYGFHKYLAELCVRHCASRWLVARCGGFVGPLLKKNAIFDILHRGPLWLRPESELQYIHTDQAASLLLDLIEGGISSEVINFCGRGVVSLTQVMQWCGLQVPVRPDSPYFRCELDLSKASTLVTLPDTEGAVHEFVTRESAP